MGSKRVYICAGARNVPLIEVLLNINGIKCIAILTKEVWHSMHWEE